VKPSQLFATMSGIWKLRLKSDPYASRIVVINTVKPHMVKKCAQNRAPST